MCRSSMCPCSELSCATRNAYTCAGAFPCEEGSSEPRVLLLHVIPQVPWCVESLFRSGGGTPRCGRSLHDSLDYPTQWTCIHSVDTARASVVFATFGVVSDYISPRGPSLSQSLSPLCTLRFPSRANLLPQVPHSCGLLGESLVALVAGMRFSLRRWVSRWLRRLVMMSVE
ncbi:hypothetical protein CEXT_601951 [Caerostris extrusa]|uniref:Uncharacterized protein n=1 Tax=Caerostris extrusa TaxID=172846 RepID=A0AAV4NIY1_CAEEX|nr:hypothetical protein CEXT_601951 [Caerostris extrusa]